jgi:hypothetical protein
MSFLDLTDVEAQEFKPIVPGDYMVQVDNAEVKDTKAGDGKYISLTFKISTPGYAGRKLFKNFNIENKSERAQQIGLSELKGFMVTADMKPILQKPSDLIGRIVMARVRIGKNRNDEPTPEIAGFMRPQHTESDSFL